MRPDGEGVFRGSIEALAGDAEYFASAEGVRSATARVRAIELPPVTNVETIPAGDRIHFAIETDRPMIGGELAAARGGARVLPDTRGNRTESAIGSNEFGRYYVAVQNQ